MWGVDDFTIIANYDVIEGALIGINFMLGTSVAAPSCVENRRFYHYWGEPEQAPHRRYFCDFGIFFVLKQLGLHVEVWQYDELT